MIRIGIVGVGSTVSIAHYHAKGYLSDKRCSVRAVYDINRKGAEDFINTLGLKDAKVTDSYDELLSMVDAVSICTPNVFHYSYASLALEKGVHVMVEKPMGVGLEECRRLVEAAKDSKAKSTVGLVYRFSDVVVKAKELIESNFTTIYTISGWFGGKRLADPQVPFEWRMDRSKSGTGALGDFMSHLSDIAYFVTGHRAESVSAFSSTFIKERDEKDGSRRSVENDDATVLNGRSGDTLIQFTVSRTGMDDVMMIITGDGGMVQFSMRDGGSLLYWPKEKDGAYSGERKNVEVKRQDTLDDWFLGEIPSFLDLIEGKECSSASLEDGLWTERLIDAGFRSSISGKEERL